jgi:hypothetical protein
MTCLVLVISFKSLSLLQNVKVGAKVYHSPLAIISIIGRCYYYLST